MKIPLEWLKEFVNIRLSPAELADRLTMAGLEVKAVEETASGVVFEAEITPNRPDWLSIYGVAREVAAVTRQKLRENGKWKMENRKNPFSNCKVLIHDAKACPRYIGRVIEGVNVSSSPEEMVKRLSAMGTRSINNVVDITNYVLFELGQPLHAFDLDKLQGSTIHIRFAKAGEEIITIDGITRKLTPQDLVIADEIRPVAIAGVMGGKETEVTESTRNTFLESACFDPMLVRRTARRLGLASESSYRFERGIPLESVLLGSDRAVEFLARLAGAQKIGPRVDAGKKTSQERKIVLNVHRVQHLLGGGITQKQVQNCLSGLGFSISKKGQKARGRKQELGVAVPGFRKDIKEEIDLAEEVARVHGYDKIPSQLPAMRETTIGPSPLLEFQRDLRRRLAGLGYDEARTHSLTSHTALKTFGQAGRSDLGKIQNPLSEEQEWMRPTLVIGLTQAAQRNFFHQRSGVRLFELSHTYSLSKGHPRESLKLGFLLGGDQPRHWQNKEEEYQWGDLKGAIEAILSGLKFQGIQWERASLPWAIEESAAEVYHQGEILGIAAQIAPKLLSTLDIEKPVFVAELEVEKLFKHAGKETARYRPLPKFPSVRRDIALELKEAVPAAQVMAVIREKGKELLESIQLFDYYQGKQIFSGNKSLAFSLEYRAPDRTLTDEEINHVHQQVAQGLMERLGAKVR
ncbi:MAG: phenylalanine--tRNA ligase subunit beta [Candidatus Omnitrophica bacterium]|nr:phenylalanine--tRNA ligase subunit beta [Candidatus Omnitrophota bacterium]